MEILIKSATIVNPESKNHLQKRDLLIKNGKIKKIGTQLNIDGAKIIEAENLHVSSGWIDLNASIQDPGMEFKEDVNSGISAAAAGGFTKIAVSPLSYPVRDSKAQIEYLINTAKNKVVDVLPYGAVSKNAEGQELAELHDMQSSGAVAFFDGKNTLHNPNMLYRALLYTQAFNGLIINFPHTKELAYQGVMNEGEVSTQLGLKGIPELAEYLMISRDIELLSYAEGKLHFSCISTAKSIEIISAARKRKLNVSCDVAAYSLLLSDEELTDFDSNYKTLPPLRSKKTIKALIKGIKNGTISAVCSDHQAEDIETKKKEFDYASFGMINLQTAFSVANTALQKEVSITEIIHLFTTGPAEILNLRKNKIEEGEKAELTLFQPKKKYVFDEAKIKSKSKNSPFIGKELSGAVVGIINNGKVQLN